MHTSLIMPETRLVGFDPIPQKQEEAEVPNFFMMPVQQLRKMINEDSYFPTAMNFRIALVLPILEPETPSGLMQHSLSAMEMAYTGNNIGRVVSIGGTVGGANNSYRDCKDLKVGDYVHYNPHAGYPYFYDHSRFLVVEDQSIVQRVYSVERHTDGVFETYKVRGLDLCQKKN